MQGRDGGRAGVVGAARKEKPQRGGQPGRRYNRQKKADGRPEKRDQNEPVNPQRTAERLAAEQIDALDIPAELRKGGRVDALKYALGANAIHGQRRSNADKRRCVEIAVKEFSGLSSRAIAELCAVSDFMVNQQRGALQESSNATRTTSDGRQYPATRRASRPSTPECHIFRLRRDCSRAYHALRNPELGLPGVVTR